MSVWENADALHQFVYQRTTSKYLNSAGNGSKKMSDMHMALWYIPKDYKPTALDGLCA